MKKFKFISDYQSNPCRLEVPTFGIGVLLF